MPGAQSVNIFSDHGTFYAASLHDGKLDMNDSEQVMAFDGLLLNALNGTALECDSAGLSCKVFDGDLKVQTPISTGTPGACAVDINMTYLQTKSLIGSCQHENHSCIATCVLQLFFSAL